MIGKIKNFLSDIYALKSLIRYSNTFRILNESIAEHSYFVSLIVLELHNHYDFAIEKALKIAILHDISESKLSDIPNNIKTQNVKFAKDLEALEEKICKKEFPKFFKYLKEFNEEKTTEAKIVKLADIYSVIQYAQTEINLGNKKSMTIIKNVSLIRAKKIEKELKNFRRKKNEC